MQASQTRKEKCIFSTRKALKYENEPLRAIKLTLATHRDCSGEDCGAKSYQMEKNLLKFFYSREEEGFMCKISDVVAWKWHFNELDSWILFPKCIIKRYLYFSYQPGFFKTEGFI